MAARRPFVAGNWKMNGLRSAVAEVDAMLAEGVPDGVEVAICPPATLVGPMAAWLADAPVEVGGQDCHAAASGAHTGDIAAEMLADAGASLVILGHSERRQNHGEGSAEIAEKVAAAWRADLRAILCVGETEVERDAGQAVGTVTLQLSQSLPAGATAVNTVIAYEPVWAIGTGRTPTLAEIAEMHQAMRSHLADQLDPAAAGAIRLIYGGSVKPANAAEIFAIDDVDGGLIGGASLRAADFLPIIKAAS
ncbi:MAG: triose-phosphate isomerase [Pseudomonadota bacterium]